MTVFHPPPSPLFISSRRAESGGSIRLILAGEFDLTARHHLQTDVEEAQDDSDRVLLDLRALTFIDCACLAVIAAAARRAEREGSILILLHPLGQVRRLLDLTGVLAGLAILDHSDFQKPFAPVAA